MGSDGYIVCNRRIYFGMLRQHKLAFIAKLICLVLAMHLTGSVFSVLHVNMMVCLCVCVYVCVPEC